MKIDYLAEDDSLIPKELMRRGVRIGMRSGKGELVVFVLRLAGELTEADFSRQPNYWKLGEENRPNYVTPRMRAIEYPKPGSGGVTIENAKNITIISNLVLYPIKDEPEEANEWGEISL